MLMDVRVSEKLSWLPKFGRLLQADTHLVRFVAELASPAFRNFSSLRFSME